MSMSPHAVYLGPRKSSRQSLPGNAGEPTVNAAATQVIVTTLNTKPRIPDLHAGAIWTSDDFDAPLPEDFLITGS
jgi:hypothetical protein